MIAGLGAAVHSSCQFPVWMGLCSVKQLSSDSSCPVGVWMEGETKNEQILSETVLVLLLLNWGSKSHVTTAMLCECKVPC